MKKEFRSLGRNILIGYIVLIVIAVYALSHVYTMMIDLSAEEDINNIPRQKIYLVTETQTLLYESETMSQLLDMQEDEYTHFNTTLDKAISNMNMLRLMAEEDEDNLRAQLDTVEWLIERKRVNTNELLAIWKEARTDLYARNINDALNRVRPLIEEQLVQEVVVEQTDSVIVTPRKRSFLKRLAEVFVPTAVDSSIVVSAKAQLQKDTLVNAYDPNEEIERTLREIQMNVAAQRANLQELLMKRTSRIRYDNSMIAARINSILTDMEEKELDLSLNRLMRRQNLLGDTSEWITGIVIACVIVMLFFLLIIGFDLFKSRYYRRKMEEALDSRERLILTISHDIRAPLSSVIGFIELLQRSHLNEQQHIYLKNMDGSSRHILSLVNGLLDYERLESGNMEIHTASFRVPVFFNEIYDSFRPQAIQKGLNFTLETIKTTDFVYTGDTIRIRQIVSNLINNALKFTDQGNVTLIVDASQLQAPDQERKRVSQLKFIVRDTGPGIPDSQKENIFAEFSRLKGTEKTEGFGLGLSITLRLVSLLKGKLDIRSEGGKGSEFIVTLPLPLAENQILSNETEQDTTQSSTEAISFGQKSVNCLIVDDDLMQIALLEEIMKKNQIRAVSCTNPLAVIEMLKENRYDIVISDMQMPGMDGFQLIKQIRTAEIPQAQSIPVVVLSGSIGKDTKKYTDAGFTACLAKPFTAKELISLLHSLLPDVKEAEQPVGDERKKAGNLDYSSLTAFAGDDKEASAAIMRTFYEETNKNIDVFRKALETKDRRAAGEMAHKMIPLFTLLGADILVQQLRLLQSNDTELTDSGWGRLLSDVIQHASSLIEEDIK